MSPEIDNVVVNQYWDDSVETSANFGNGNILKAPVWKYGFTKKRVLKKP